MNRQSLDMYRAFVFPGYAFHKCSSSLSPFPSLAPLITQIQPLQRWNLGVADFASLPMASHSDARSLFPGVTGKHNQLVTRFASAAPARSVPRLASAKAAAACAQVKFSLSTVFASVIGGGVSLIRCC